MNEAILKRVLTQELKLAMPGAVIFRHEDRFTRGIPDFSITFGERTVWVEVKYTSPRTKGKLSGAQRLVVSRLVRHGRAMIVTYTEFKTGLKLTSVDVPVGRDMMQSQQTEGFKHAWVADAIKKELLRPGRGEQLDISREDQ